VDDPKYALIHVFDPSSNTIRADVQRVVLEYEQSSARNNAHLHLVAAKSAAFREQSSRLLASSKVKGAEGDKRTGDFLKTALVVSRPVTVISGQSKDMQLLRPAILPISVLLDENRTIVCVLTGAEPRLVRRIMDIVGPRSP